MKPPPYYQSIGIDNYNIHHDTKIDGLSEIANYYLHEIEQSFPFFDEINLCGWSLGGQIALEMAYILEQKGFKKIKVYLFDTVLNDKRLEILRSSLDITEIHCHLKKHMLEQNIDEDYVEKICSAHGAEASLSKAYISGILFYSEVILFKAIEMNEMGHLRMEKYVSSLRDNNVQAVVHKRIKIERLNCHHGNILKNTNEIIRVLLNDFSVKAAFYGSRHKPTL